MSNNDVGLDFTIYTYDDDGIEYMQNLPVDSNDLDFFAQPISDLLNDNSLNPHATRHLTSERALKLLIDGPQQGLCTLKVSRRNLANHTGYTWRLDTEETFINTVQAPIAIPIIDHLLSPSSGNCDDLYIQNMIKISSSHEYRAMLWFAQKMVGTDVIPSLFLDGLWNGNQAKFIDFTEKLDWMISNGYFPNSNPHAVFDSVYVERLTDLYKHVFESDPNLSPFVIEQRPTAYFESSLDGREVLPVISTAFMKYSPTTPRVTLSAISGVVSTFHKN